MSDFFSGILTNALWDFIKSVVIPKRPAENAPTTLITQKNIDVKVHDTTAGAQYSGYSERLNRFLQLVNQWRFAKLSPSKIAEILGEKNATDSIDFFSGSRIPDFDYLARLNSAFGFNTEFFHGTSDQIFDVTWRHSLDAKGYLRTVKQLMPILLFFVMDRRGNVSIFAKLDEYRFEMVAGDLTISGEVGATGLYNMKALADLIRSIRDEKIGHISVILTSEQYVSLVNGSTYPGMLDHPRIPKTHWADDFIDLEYFSGNRETYREKYGNALVAGLELIS